MDTQFNSSPSILDQPQTYTGRRKSSVATVQLIAGTGVFTINNISGIQYMQEKEDLPDKNKKTYARSIKIFLQYLNKDDVLMYVIDRFMIRNFITALKKQFEPSTIRTILSNLGVIWGYAREIVSYGKR